MRHSPPHLLLPHVEKPLCQRILFHSQVAQRQHRVAQLQFVEQHQPRSRLARPRPRKPLHRLSHRRVTRRQPRQPHRRPHQLHWLAKRGSGNRQRLHHPGKVGRSGSHLGRADVAQLGKRVHQVAKVKGLPRTHVVRSIQKLPSRDGTGKTSGSKTPRHAIPAMPAPLHREMTMSL